MPSIFKKALRLVLADDPITPLLKVPKKYQPPTQLTQRELIQLESQLSQTIFGALPAHVIRREFFNLDTQTWIWHEEQQGMNGEKIEMTTRYEIQPQGVLKIQPGPRYVYIEGLELQNFMYAVKEYYERVAINIYKVDPHADR